MPLPAEGDDEDDYDADSLESVRKVKSADGAFKKPSVRFNLKKAGTEPVETTKYKPTGKMVYNQSVVESLENRLGAGGEK